LNLLVVALALALQTTDAARVPSRVIVVSFDAAGYVTTSHLLADGKLPSFDRMVRGGAWSDGMMTSFPTKTAAQHERYHVVDGDREISAIWPRFGGW